ncbi:hypothetical protein PAXRUDRAFT_152537 [Paxillus rubicundulus Ve08.2h10]|uniref:PH domain-containing protein n=1 Tax=Paxillus rubicundulus Ve08.2h10 TaxID=930991 RepID=A0A0D0CU05_9AGAM|nr:hypothetical protein PAXRUDRAFT_152537 [Paxillus rubicundulus Ve08.2h10]
MPEKILPMIDGVHEAMGQGDNEDDDHSEGSASLFRIMDHHAFSFFLREGGRKEDWDENTRANVRGELMKRWRESPWTRPFRRVNGHHATHTQRWIGRSFEIGDVLGVNILGKHVVPPPALSFVPETHQKNPQVPDASTPVVSSSMGLHSNWTAQTNPSSSSQLQQGSYSSLSLPVQHSGEVSEDLFSSSSPLIPTSSAPSLPIEQRPDDFLKPILNQEPGTQAGQGANTSRGVSLLDRSIKHRVSLRRQRAELAIDDTYDEGSPQDNGSTDEVLVPPDAVLARTGSQVHGSSAGAAVEADSSQNVGRGDIILRDRMLVRVSYSKSESLPVRFDEEQNRQTSHLQYEDWAEFLVVWRKDNLEIYEDYTIPGKEYFLGHKNLAFLVPLKSERTSLSLYSFADLTFCILCPPTLIQNIYSKARTLFNYSKEGTNVFVFKVKSRTRAQDWVWYLWRQLGGKIPSSIEICCPNIDTRVRIDVPVADTINLDKAYIMFSRKNIIELVHNSLLRSGHGPSDAGLRSWRYTIERELQAGRKLALAWRSGTQLDWVWQEEDVEGNARPWAVLMGLSLQQGTKASHLDIRLAEHFPSTVHLSNGKKMFEPPAIEGYLDRIKPQGQGHQQVYLVTHGGNLFSLSPWDANPPTSPSTHLSYMVSGERASVEQYSKDMSENEIKRGVAQIRAAYGVMDLKNISAVKRVHPSLSIDDSEVVERDTVDEEDEGGPEGLAKVQDKLQLRLRRSFEIIFTSGPVLRLEAHSCRDCIEWITRLRTLVTYWSQRYRMDAKDEMDVAYMESKSVRLTPQPRKYNRVKGHPTPSEPPIGSGSSLPALTSLYPWCALDNCRSIVKAGRVFARKGLRGQYKLVQLFLVSGSLIGFHVSPKSALHHCRSKGIGLLDAYVCSGHLAALALRRSEYGPESPNLPRRYDDGLETEQPEEDVLFVIWYRKSPLPSQSCTKASQGIGSTAPIPALSANHKIVVFRARCKVERDAWCWALGCEIDKVVRINRDRERRIREAGGLVDLSN